MTDQSRKPFVTFYVMAYNQERFVREAVEGALGQTYSPTEIVLSDDCSTDDTFTIIQEVVKGYSGPHKIVLNRNDRNLGVSAHVNRIIELATGELIVAADGDDVSEPGRTERCVDVWLNQGRPTALASSVSCIDANGRPSKTKDGMRLMAPFLPTEHETRAASLVRFSKRDYPRLISCSGAWTKELHDVFGPLCPGIWHEDGVISFRAWLYDRIVAIPEPLVRYREHDSNIVNRIPIPLTTPDARQGAEQASRTHARRCKESLSSYMPDLEMAVSRRWITQPMYEEIKRGVKAQCVFHEVVEKWWIVGWITRLAMFLVLVRRGQVREASWCGPRLLPLPIFLRLAAVWSRRRAWKIRLSVESHLLTVGYLLTMAV